MPRPDFETVTCKEGCKTCRHYYVYKFSFSPDYDAIQFDNHYTKCELCQAWVEKWNLDNKKTWEGVNLWQ